MSTHNIYFCGEIRIYIYVFVENCALSGAMYIFEETCPIRHNRPD